MGLRRTKLRIAGWQNKIVSCHPATLQPCPSTFVVWLVQISTLRPQAIPAFLVIPVACWLKKTRVIGEQMGFERLFINRKT